MAEQAGTVTILSFGGCPHVDIARERVTEALRRAGLEGGRVDDERVETIEDAERLRFRGSPTILINGRDPFANEDAPIGLACRIYETPNGADGAPSIEQLVDALQA